ncbi:hypothetical protein J6590_033802 [Homalodisca vitripennis]|nr:hypothetical protein J6590_033802 [Homalodisca vitripennis]
MTAEVKCEGTRPSVKSPIVLAGIVSLSPARPVSWLSPDPPACPVSQGLSAGCRPTHPRARLVRACQLVVARPTRVPGSSSVTYYKDSHASLVGLPRTGSKSPPQTVVGILWIGTRNPPDRY